MNVTLSSRDFLRELELLAKVSPQKPSIPVLANVLVQAEGTGIRLAATDLEVGLITFCPATVHEPGTTTLPVKHLLEIIKLLPDREVTLVLDEKMSVKLSAGTYNSRLQVAAASDYPRMPSMKDLPTLALPPQLQSMIRRVRFAVSDKDKKYYMDGGLLTGKSLAATDGHRLALTACEDFGLAEPVIIPSKTLDKLAEMLVGEAIFAVGEKHLFFVVDGRLLFSRMVAGEFPKYERIVPRDTTRVMTVQRAALQEALQRMVLTSNEVSFTFSTNQLTMNGRCSGLGTAAEQVDINYDGSDTVVTLQGAYLLDFLNAAEGAITKLEWKDGGTLLFTDSSEYAYVQMPMRNV